MCQWAGVVYHILDVRTDNYHVKKIFTDSELQEDSVIRKFRITAAGCVPVISIGKVTSLKRAVEIYGLNYASMSIVDPL